MLCRWGLLAGRLTLTSALHHYWCGRRGGPRDDTGKSWLTSYKSLSDMTLICSEVGSLENAVLVEYFRLRLSAYLSRAVAYASQEGFLKVNPGEWPRSPKDAQSHHGARSPPQLAFLFLPDASCRVGGPAGACCSSCSKVHLDRSGKTTLSVLASTMARLPWSAIAMGEHVTR